ncbi:GNAT family N-acetyltransferase [Collimonas sp. OK412]|jgi:RimJ/RimL family protein N-acetyltransferase|uniref:GNAT family N-acetyltransferase n=1 Tax=Collimonas sp. (strain OK412) TaxID=1801619 RepID=UPI0008DFB552|nr:GNAT family protein [Collimonas sp. OK412]SFC94577.1 Protein N-acetyltransferase, RimJ/RimL family [Collimonas sp. OK412]
MHYIDLPDFVHELVALRPLSRADAAAWYAYLTMPRVLDHTSWDLRSMDDLMQKFDALESLDPASEIRLAIVRHDSGALVGTIGFHSISLLHKTVEIAYDLAPAVWGKDIAPAVCNAVAEWGFSYLGAVRIQATVLDSNTRSIRVLEKCGFQCEGLLRSFRMVRGHPRNFWIYSRLDLRVTEA